MEKLRGCFLLAVFFFILQSCGDNKSDPAPPAAQSATLADPFSKREEIVSLICTVSDIPEGAYTLLVESYAWDKFYPVATHSLKNGKVILQQFTGQYQMGLYRLIVMERNDARPVYFVVNGMDKKLELAATFDEMLEGKAAITPQDETFCLAEIIRLHQQKMSNADSIKKALGDITVINPKYYTLKDGLRIELEKNNLEFYKALDLLAGEFPNTYVNHAVIKLLRKPNRMETDSLAGHYETEPAMLNRHYFNGVNINNTAYMGHPVLFQSVNEFITEYAGERPHEWVSSIASMMQHISDASIKKAVADYLVFYYLDRSQDDVAGQIAFAHIEGCTDDYIATLKKSNRYRSGPAINTIVPEFSLPDRHGKDLMLQELLTGNKLVLLYFWKSSCEYCKEQHPAMKRIYDLYHDRGLEIAGISLDIDKKAWLQAIETHGLNWVNLCDLKGTVSPVVNEYAVKSTPSIFITDGKGRLLAKDISGAQLLDFFKTYYK